MMRIVLRHHTYSICQSHAHDFVEGVRLAFKPYREPGSPPRSRLFVLERSIDHSGISGLGIVAEGVQFTDGQVVMKWLTETSSVSLFESLDDVRKVHGHGGDSVVRILEIEDE